MGRKYDPKNLLVKGYWKFIEEKKQIISGKNWNCWKSKINEAKKKVVDKDLSGTSSLGGDDSDKCVDIPDIPSLEGDEEELKKGKELKVLTPNELLTRLPILFAQIKARNNSGKLKKEMRQILYLFYQHNKIPKRFYNKLIKSL